MSDSKSYGSYPGPWSISCFGASQGPEPEPRGNNEVERVRFRGVERFAIVEAMVGGGGGDPFQTPGTYIEAGVV